ncbi:MAG: ATP-dependent zinc metalloprotease FtsH, partial [Prevotellaceae bacterium]|nr:ATP-dependent zinc metalloprotease FtsH [Prevotellaceae bacterium]
MDNPNQAAEQKQQSAKSNPPDSRIKKRKFSHYWLYFAVVIVFITVQFWGITPSREVSITAFEKILTDSCVKKIHIVSAEEQVEAEIDTVCAQKIFNEKIKFKGAKSFKVYAHYGSSEEFEKKLEKLKENGVFTGEITYKKGRDILGMIIYTILPIVLIFGIFIYMSNRVGGKMAGGIFNIGRAKAQIFDKKKDNKITFKDVAGLESAKQEIQEIVEFLKNPQKYTELGGKIPKGALLVGPPGTGKTLLAKAVAGEADVPFFSLSGSDFVEMFVGVGASRVRDLFAQAKIKSPSIIFIDEIDAIGKARGKNPNMGVNDERESTLNQLLTEMDGFGTNSGVILLAATNRADILDKALLRAGRFDRQIHVDLPDIHERKEIFEVHLRPLKIDETLDKDFLARQTPGFSGADIANVCNEAALIAARSNKKAVGKQDFLDAVDRIVGGLERKNKIMTVEEKRSVAFHEAGHATVSWMLEHGNPLVKVTIVPRGMALGAAWYLPEERQFTTVEHILDEVCSLLGGRASETVFFNTASTGALNDLERVTKQVYAMVAYYGMSKSLPNISYYDSTGQYDFGFTKPYSDTTGKNIDSEVQRIVEEQFERAKNILRANEEGVKKIAQILIEREVLFADQLCDCPLTI